MLSYYSPQQRQRRSTRFQRPPPPLRLLFFSRRSRSSPTPLSLSLFLLSSPLSPLVSSSARCSCALEKASDSSSAVRGGSSAAPAASVGGSIHELERVKEKCDRVFCFPLMHFFGSFSLRFSQSEGLRKHSLACVSCLSPLSGAASAAAAIAAKPWRSLAEQEQAGPSAERR